MAKLTDLEKVRRKRQRHRLVRNLLVLTILAGAIWCAMWAVEHAGELDLKTAYSDIKAEIATGSGFPVPLPGGKVLQLDAVNNVLMLLSNTNLYSYNASGRQMLNEQHGFINQALVTGEDRMLMYDRGGSKLSLYSKSALLDTITTDYKIYTADLSLNGNYAVATTSREYVAHVKVYNKSGQDIFNWYSYQKPVVSVSLCDTKDEMMVGCVDVSDGSYLSSISKFQFSINQELNKVEFPDELLLFVDYRSSNRIFALTDKRAILLNQDLKELKSYDYEGQKLNRIVESRDNQTLMLILGDYAENKHLKAVVLDNEFQLLGEFEVDYEITDSQIDTDYVYMISKNQLEILQHDGTKLMDKQINGIQNIHLIQEQLYYITSSELDSINIAEMLKPLETNSQEEPSLLSREPSTKSRSKVQETSKSTASKVQKTEQNTLEKTALESKIKN